MASKGAFVSGTDGSDFAHRQRVASHYQMSVLNKSRLKFCIFLHYMVFIAMMVKLSEDILDRFDVFILELEELYIPKPRLWEWIWTSSVLFTIIGLSALRNNNVSAMKFYVLITLVLGLCPVIYAAIYYFNDLWIFVNTQDVSRLTEVWRGYPMALVWYAFLVVALQIHFFQIFFGIKLIFVWKVRKTPKKTN